ncbi:MAG: CPCC family cysteine-rich protein [Longimicrobiaceae bacterium]
MSESTQARAEYPCPCCGYLVFPDPPGSYEVCPVCNWEDDALQLEFATTLTGGADHTTLARAQENFRIFGASEPSAIRFCRAAGDTPRDPEWRPIDPSRDGFEDFPAPTSARAPDDPEALYYWRDSFWRRSIAEGQR